MTADFNRPGIYISETLTPLTGASGIPGTAIATFAANFNMGPTVPTFVSSWSQYTKLYGTFATAHGSYLHYAVFQYFNNGGSGCYVLSVPNTDAVGASLVLQDINSPPDNVLTVKTISPGAWGNNIYIAITSAGNTGRFNFQVFNGGTSQANLAENFVDLSINPADPRNVISIVNSPSAGSKYITVTSTIPGSYSPGVDDPALIAATPLSGGSDGSTSPVLATAVPASLDMIQGTILNVNLPGISDIPTINALISWAEGRGDVMIVVDGPVPAPPESSAQVAANYVNMVTGGTPLTSSTYATLYAPWISITDPASTNPGATVWTPPGGAVLGIWSSTDNAEGPWQAPAGISFGEINLQNLEALFSSDDLDTLNENNINAIRFVPGYFPALMGVRTLEAGFPDRYISVRRTLILLEHQFTTLLQYALFEPNGPDLWAQVTNSLENYLTGLMQQGVLGGSTQDTTFNVTCDASNNPPASANAGILNVDVGVALQSPAEFIVINISQFQNTGATTITTTTP
jgi:uncharacterized protein